MNQPKVSVLISFYNLAPYVDKTMETVLAQKTNFPVEVLCADDGSDDGTIESCACGSRNTQTPSACSSWTVSPAQNMRPTTASSG